MSSETHFMSLSLEDVREVIGDINYKNWTINYNVVQGGVFLKPTFIRTDSTTGRPGYCENMRPWYVEFWRDKGYLVQTIFKMIEAAEEHELREEFKYKGEAIYGPHRIQSSIS